MDSKLRKMAVITSLAVILLIGLVVIRMNRKDQPSDPKKSPEPAAKQTGLPQDSLLPGQIGTDLSAFEKDPAFFDPEKNPFLEALLDESDRLTLFVTSVEKDLRIQIRDYTEKPVTGQSFLVVVENVGEYKDLDRDGVIYIGDLPAGDYHVSLKPVSGYRIPENSTRIHVKDKVEYVPIEDISLLVKTEEEIDALAEDTEILEAKEESDKTELTALTPPAGNGKAGIDVSKWQGEIDWAKVKEAGVEFAIIRAGYRGSVTGSLVQDPYFEKNMAEATAAGIPVGVYFFTQAVNQVEAVEEASMVIELMKHYKVDLPVFIDTEGAGENARAKDLDVETRTAVCDAFCATIQNAGYTGGVYASRCWYQDMLNTPKLEKYFIWLAEYTDVPKYEGYYGMWQHSSKGQIGGIKGNVDLDILYE